MGILKSMSIEVGAEHSSSSDQQKDQYLKTTLMKSTKTSEEITSDLSIFQFDDYSEFLHSYVNLYGKYTHGPYNLSNWSKRLGYKSPSSLTMVLNKQRIPPVRMVHRLAEDFKLTPSETKYFLLLVEIERLKSKGKDYSEQLRMAHSISKKKKYIKINLDQFSIVSDWYCFVIKRLVTCKNYIQDIDWIHRSLRKKVSKPQIKDALERLQSVGLIEEVNGRYIDPKKKLHTGDQVAAVAIKNHHRGMIGQALEALQEQDVDNRMIQGLTLNMNKRENLKEAFEDIREFISEFNAKYSNESDSDSVYQLNIQLFEHTKDVEQ